nr:reverse transcriptase domain-containing protein [Tanacetum cinerariifolium]
LSDSFPPLTPFKVSDFILEEIDAYLKDESVSPEIDHVDCDPEGDICLSEKLLNDDPFQLLLMDLKQGEDKLFELAKIPLNENCLAMLLKKLPEKIGDPGKFLNLCDFLGMDVCHALTNLGASINLMPLFILKKLSLPELTPTRMTLELADRSITRPKGVAKDVFVKVGKFHFPVDFVVVDFEADPHVPLILGRSFLRTGHALIDVYGEQINLQVNDEAVTFNLNQTTRYSSTYDDFSVNRIDIIHVTREEYAQEILGFSSNSSSGHLEYAYLEGVDKLPVIISKDLKFDEKEALFKKCLNLIKGQLLRKSPTSRVLTLGFVHTKS